MITTKETIFDLEMPEPDTHCFDIDTQQDVWSYSLNLLQEVIASKDAVISELRYKLAYKDAKIKVLEEQFKALKAEIYNSK